MKIPLFIANMDFWPRPGSNTWEEEDENLSSMIFLPMGLPALSRTGENPFL
jgi:hypothetical protein